MKYQEIRQANIEKILANVNDKCGRDGRAFELQCARDGSKKTTVAKQGETDNHLKIRKQNGKIEYAPMECKTTGGRVDELLKGSEAKYVVYKYDFVQVHKATKKLPERYEERHVSAKVIPTALFLAKLQEFGAIKEMRHDGKVDGLGIQPSKKQWYEWLKDYPVEFDNQATYEWWEFEGLE